MAEKHIFVLLSLFLHPLMTNCGVEMRIVHVCPLPVWFRFIKQKQANVQLHKYDKNIAYAYLQYTVLFVNLHRVLFILPQKSEEVDFHYRTFAYLLSIHTFELCGRAPPCLSVCLSSACVGDRKTQGSSCALLFNGSGTVNQTYLCQNI